MTRQVVEDLNQQTQRLEPTLELGGIVRVGLNLLVGNLGGLLVHDPQALCQSCTHRQKPNEGLSEVFHDMVYLLVKLVGLEQRSPPHENGMCNLQNSVRDFEVIWRYSANKILEDESLVFWAFGHLLSLGFNKPV